MVLVLLLGGVACGGETSGRSTGGNQLGSAGGENSGASGTGGTGGTGGRGDGGSGGHASAGTGGTSGAGGLAATGGLEGTSGDAGAAPFGGTSGTDGGCSGAPLPDVNGECPVPVNECHYYHILNCCQDMWYDPGTTCTSEGGSVCDGYGSCVACTVASDCPAVSSACVKPACSSFSCGVEPVESGTACSENGGDRCDGSGACVPSHCFDDVQDEDETDINCGGSCPERCQDNHHCSIDADCASGLCDDGAIGTCIACGTDADCPTSLVECVMAVCSDGVCGTVNLDQTHALSVGQTAGDCRVVVCDGAGGTLELVDVSDIPMSPSACTISPTCDTSGHPSFSSAPTGTDCSTDGNPPAHVCADDDGLYAGSCVACNIDGDCASLLTCGGDHQCH